VKVAINHLQETHLITDVLCKLAKKVDVECIEKLIYAYMDKNSLHPECTFVSLLFTFHLSVEQQL
jgi:hypothetical protein